MIIKGINYPIIGKINFEEARKMVPVVDIPMMSDEKWRALTSTPEQVARRMQKQTAIRAGYSPDTAEQIGYQLLQKTSVRTCIDKAMAEHSKPV